MRMKFTVTERDRHRFKFITEAGKSVFQSSTSYATEEEAREIWAGVERTIRAPVREEADAALARGDGLASRLKTTENSLQHFKGEFEGATVRADDLQSELTKSRMAHDDLEKELARCNEIREGLQEAVMQAGDRRNEDVRAIESLKSDVVEARKERDALANRNLWQRLFGRSDR